jgi:hypothetical protein
MNTAHNKESNAVNINSDIDIDIDINNNNNNNNSEQVSLSRNARLVSRLTEFQFRPGSQPS